jgi:hypothetical protein
MLARDGLVSVTCPTLASGGVVQACGIVDGGEIESRGRPGRVKGGVFENG